MYSCHVPNKADHITQFKKNWSSSINCCVSRYDSYFSKNKKTWLLSPQLKKRPTDPFYSLRWFARRWTTEVSSSRTLRCLHYQTCAIILFGRLGQFNGGQPAGYWLWLLHAKGESREVQQRAINETVWCLCICIYISRTFISC